MPAESMIERVSKALCCPGRICGNAEKEYAVCQAHTFRKDARAAIEAIRDFSAAKRTLACVLMDGAGSDAAWESIFDSALKEGE